MTKNARPDLVLIAFAAFLMIAARPLSDVVFQSDTDGGGFGLSNFSKVHASTGAFPRAEIADAQAGALHATNLTADAAALATLNATTANLASAQAGALHATNLTADTAALATLNATTATLASAQAGALHATNLTAGFFSAPAISVTTVTNATNVFGRATGGHLEADTVTDRSATNWWVIINIPNPDPATNWTDVTIKLSTNGFVPNEMAWGYQTDPVFRWTSAASRLDGSPSWESFQTNWFPTLVFQTAVRAGSPLDPNYKWWLVGLRDSTISIHDWLTSREWLSNPSSWTFYMRSAEPWFHPANRIDGIYLLQNNTSNETHHGWMGAGDGANWRRAVISWVSYDPRPAKLAVIQGAGTWPTPLIYFTNQHQTP